MLGGYSDVAEFYMDDDEQQQHAPDGDQAVPLPNEYLPKFPAPDPWHRNASCPEDFVMIAEFSEQEGPKPLLTIPDDLHTSMDLNEFSVKIMSVDFQTLASEKFTVSDDTQVVISQSQHGVHAYIHHFTLYDRQARGFVRPFCMTYVTPDDSKIMALYDDLQSEFNAVAQFFKYGNLELFVNDMIHYHSDLQYTKVRHNDFKQDEDGSGDDLDSRPEDRAILQSLTTPSLTAAIAEVKQIIDTTSNMLSDENWGDMRSRFEKFRQRQQGEPVSPDDDPRGMLLACDGFGGQFRGGGGGEGQEGAGDRFSRSVSECHPVPAPATNSRSRAVSCSDIATTTPAYEPQLVRTSHRRRFEKQLRSLDDLCPFGAEEGKKKLNTIYKYFCRDMATLLVERKDAKLMEPNCGLLSIGSNVEVNFLTGLSLDGLNSKGGMKASQSVLSGRWDQDDSCSFQSAESFLSCQEDLDEHASFGSYEVIATEDPARDTARKEDIELTTSILTQSSQSTGSGGASSGYSSTKPGPGPMKMMLFSSTDHLHCMGPAMPGYGLRQLVREHAVAPHVLYAVLCGRPVVVTGNRAAEARVRAAVTALAVLVPGHHSGAIVPWRTDPNLTLADLGTVKLVGLRWPDNKRTCLHSYIRKHVTVFDVEKRVLTTPGYQGGIVTDICNKHKFFSTNTAYVAYVHSVLMELSSKAFLYFHAFCMNPQQPISGEHANSEVFHRSQQAFFTKIKVGADDSHIIQYLADVIVNQQLREFSAQDVVNPDQLTNRIQLSNKKSGMFYYQP